MKKALIGTSALIAVGVLSAQAADAADRISLGLSGNYRVVGGFVSQDDGNGESVDGARDHGIGTDGRVNFRGSTTLDNGLEVGVQIELEGQTVDDIIDENYIWIENTDVWGRIELGNRDGADNKMNVLAPFVHGTLIAGVQTIMLASAPGAAGASAFTSTNAAQAPLLVPGISGDSTKITYYTPRFAGVQLGISYTPETDEALGANFGVPVAQLENEAGDLGEVVEIGSNWNGNFGDAGIAASLTYATAEAEGANRNDRDEWTAGLTVSWMGWAIGGQYENGETGGGAATTVVQRDDIQYRAGATYSLGPWLLGLQYAKREVEVNANGEDEVEIWALGARRTLGPGITAGAAVHFWTWEDDAGLAANENDATEFMLVTEVNF